MADPLHPDPLSEAEARALLQARIIAGALMAGVAVFTGVATALVVFGAMRPAQLPGSIVPALPDMAVILGGIAALMLITALPVGLTLRKAVWSGKRDEHGRLDPGAFTAGTLLTLALIEGPALLAGVAILVSSSLWPGVIALVGLAAFIVVFPSGSHIRAPANPENPYRSIS